MRVPFSWLKEYIQTSLTVDQVADALTMAGLEVEAIERSSPPFEGVVVGEVLETNPHPEADKLRIAQVSDGTQTFTVVCGASNCRAGIKVAFAKIGAILRAEEKPLKIKPSKLRGIESQGMLCSATELGLGEDHDGIVELATSYEVGRDLATYYSEAILHLGLTPNLGHCFSIYGVARELAAITQEPLIPPVAKVIEGPTPNPMQVEVQDREGCPRYAGRLIRGVTIGTSPSWIQDKLRAAGMRPINSVVDVTNLVMLELGEPLHAFDADTLSSQQIIVRKAHKQEMFTTLDGVNRRLSERVLLICDAEKPVAAAGVMGGQSSEVSSQTKNVFLEAAYFDPLTIRRSSKDLQLQTEASKRFERGCDPEAVLLALDRAVTLIQSVAGGEICRGVVDERKQPFSPRTLSLRMDRLNEVLGTQLSTGEVEGLLRRHHCAVSTSERTLSVTVPSFRSDLTQEVDLIEEIGRLYGYGNIIRKAPIYQAATLPHTPLFLFERTVRQALIGMGLQEFMTGNLISPKLASTTLATSEWISVLNPSSVDQSILRPSLFPGLLQVVSHNATHQIHDIAGFEIGRVHFRAGDQLSEQTEVGIVLSGRPSPSHWDSPDRWVDFFDLKGTVESLLEAIGVMAVRFEVGTLPNFHPGRQARVLCEEQPVGFLGEVHPSRVRALDLRYPVFYAELTLPALMALRTSRARFHSLPQYPGSLRDWTVPLSEETPVGVFVAAAQSLRSRLLKKVTFTAIYRGDSVGAGWKNATFRFLYRDDRKTVSDQVVDDEHERVVQQIKAQLGERIRS